MVAFRYRHSFTVEICGVLTILKVIEYIINQINRRKGEYKIKIALDYSAVINFLSRRGNFISNWVTLQVLFNKLIFLEKVNAICDKKAKILIQSETRETVPFPFSLSSPYVMVNRTVISQPEELERYLSIAIMRNYFKNRYNIDPALIN